MSINIRSKHIAYTTVAPKGVITPFTICFALMCECWCVHGGWMCVQGGWNCASVCYLNLVLHLLNRLIVIRFYFDQHPSYCRFRISLAKMFPLCSVPLLSALRYIIGQENSSNYSLDGFHMGITIPPRMRSRMMSFPTPADQVAVADL